MFVTAAEIVFQAHAYAWVGERADQDWGSHEEVIKGVVQQVDAGGGVEIRVTHQLAGEQRLSGAAAQQAAHLALLDELRYDEESLPALTLLGFEDVSKDVVPDVEDVFPSDVQQVTDDVRRSFIPEQIGSVSITVPSAKKRGFLVSTTMRSKWVGPGPVALRSSIGQPPLLSSAQSSGPVPSEISSLNIDHSLPRCSISGSWLYFLRAIKLFHSINNISTSGHISLLMQTRALAMCTGLHDHMVSGQ
ncbi:hypothetical protein EYF80_018415 [Liparis tanakae]|uniref:Uncharacterized protein n=1 Tax=Liparis tanakae TaxID=230148 RepID=A0A4Z2I053_9TELE|nr:hypothetical protein EYF80_018415 [Liparis tanakae]